MRRCIVGQRSYVPKTPGHVGNVPHTCERTCSLCRGDGMSQAIVNNVTIPGRENDPDAAETAEWLEGLRYVLDAKGPERVSYLLSVLEEEAYRQGVEIPFSANTPYINTIPADKQPV